MTRSAELTANGHAHAIVLTGVLWVLVVLAGLNEIATTNPGVPLVAPGTGEIVVTALIGIAVVAVGFALNARASQFRPGCLKCCDCQYRANRHRIRNIHRFNPENCVTGCQCSR